MRAAEKIRLGLAGIGLAAAGTMLVAGCTSTVDGNPVAAPTGHTGTTSTARTSTSPGPGPATTSAPTATAAPPGTIPLEPNERGYVFIETKSGKTRCQISSTAVGCEAQFTNSPLKDGEHANGVNISADGTVDWILGNLGAIPTVTIDYQTYHAQGWTIAATIEGTRFTNDGTGHGMFVSIDNVETF